MGRERRQRGVDVEVPAPRRLTRRHFLRGSGVAAVSAGVTGLAACTDERTLPAPDTRPVEPDVYCAVGFFSAHEALTVDALVGRILPGTPDDPGAREAGVVNYIDCLLATSHGVTEPMYLQPPFPAPEDEDLAPLEAAYPDLPPLVRGGEPEAPELAAGGEAAGAVVDLRDDSVESTSYGVIPIPQNQFDRYGFQSLLRPSELFRRGLAALDAHARARFGAAFVDLGDADQDALVEDLAEDRAEAFDVPSGEAFFELARRYTIEGTFSDPIYGGNRDLVGWKLLGYPGAQRAYTPDDVRDPDFRRESQGLAELHRFNAGHADRPEPVRPVAGARREGG